MYLVLAFFIWVVIVAYIGAPFWRSRLQPSAAINPDLRAATENREALLVRRDDLLRDLKDLEFDLEMGKIDPADYQELRASTAEAAAAVLEQLEATIPVPPSARSRRKRRAEASQAAASNGKAQPAEAVLAGSEMDVEAEILIARARRHATTDNGTSTEPDSAIEIATATASDTWECKSCGRVMSNADRFCGSCGTPRD